MPLTVLITSGPTREYIDPVRYISNASSGIMGSSLCRASLKRGLKVVLITGPVFHKYPKGAKVVNVKSADEMFSALKRNYVKADIVIGASAVSDFKPLKKQRYKFKKNAKKQATLKLTRNPDIIAYAGKNKKNRVVLGFALETDKLIINAKKKLKEKNLDFIIANSEKSIGNAKSTVFIIKRDSEIRRLKDKTKEYISGIIIDEAIKEHRLKNTL